MRRLWWVFGVLTVAACAVAQGGQGGGGFGGGQGGFGGGGQGQGQGGVGQGQEQDGSDGNLRGPFPYLNQRETTSILTPGEYVEWELDLKQSQVVIAEARSEAFDPALEIVEGEKVLMDNDDRYPGDQRPLLLWTCPKDGKYLLRIRSFRGRAGGQVFSRHVVLNCQSLKPGPNTLRGPDPVPMLLKASLKSGDVVQPFAINADRSAAPIRSTQISPVGLPCPNLIPALTEALVGALCAPVDGDYYFYIDPSAAGAYQDTEWKVLLNVIPAVAISSTPAVSIQKNVYGALWALSVKKGDFVHASTGYGRFGPALYISYAPEFSSFDPKDHPFAPRAKEDKEPWFTLLPVMGSGESSKGLIANRDCTIWITQGMNNQPGERKLEVQRASREINLPTVSGRLPLNTTQYWDFQASPGDVVKLALAVKGFASEVTVYSPTLETVAQGMTFSEEDRKQMVFVASQTGRYLVAVSCQGHGGTGDYRIERDVIPAEDLDVAKKVEQTLASGDVKVYRVRFPANSTKLFKITGSPNYQIRSASGGNAHLNQFSIVNTRYYHMWFNDPQSFLVVIHGTGSKFTLSFVDPP